MYTVYTERHQLHATQSVRIHGEQFNEVPARAEAIRQAVTEAGLGPVVAPTDHGLAPAQAVHDAGLLEFLQTIYAAGERFRHSGPQFMADTFATRGLRRRSTHPWAQIGYYAFDVETPFFAGTWEAAYWSAQCALTAADYLLGGERAAYALCRPPGHHASAGQIGGFCYLNNAAIAARYLQAAGGGERVAILDVDYHHGNGTQEIFYADPSVLFVSLHAHPDEDYPFFWGAEDERGEGPGVGFNVNLPLAKGARDDEYLAALGPGLAALRAAAPKYLILSLGLDIAAGDPSALGGGFAITADGFRAIGQAVAALALPTLIVQEGGYGLQQLGRHAVETVSAFAAG